MSLASSQNYYEPYETYPNYLPLVPPSILQRHRARVLDPTDAVAPGWKQPSPAVYRTDALLISNDLLSGRPLRKIRKALGKIGLELDLPCRPDCGDAPRPIRLTVKEHGRRPAVVDAWAALQQMRMRTPDLMPKISLEHLMFSSDVTWSGVGGAYGPSQPPLGGTAAAASYTRSRSSGRLPVVLFATDPPPRRDNLGMRRPVVAVIDSGVVAHRWLGVPSVLGGSSFVAVDQALQNDISQNSDEQPNDLATFLEQRMVPDTLIGELDSHWGHGTFITGILRQAAPDAQVLAIRAMYSDGVAREGDVLRALDRIATRVATAQKNGDGSRMVDIVSLSLGFYPESDTEVPQNIATQIDKLIRLGVLVCAAAGNDSTTRRFYPAALSDRSVSPGQPLISVGSLNPNRSKSLFSNDDDGWVQCWAPGASVVSTFPCERTGSVGPDYTNEASAPPGVQPRRDALDDDDFRSGFALWNGTSFAAPMVAAKLATILIANSGSSKDLRLDQVTTAATMKRAEAAAGEVKRCVWPE